MTDAPASPVVTRPTFDEYLAWLGRAHQYANNDSDATYYATVVERIRQGFDSSGLVSGLVNAVREAADTYKRDIGYTLLAGDLVPPVTKPYESFLHKTYRRNAVNNPRWPDAPEDGWTTPANWFSGTPDLVRTIVVVKYLDGVAYLAEKLGDYAERRGLAYEVSLEARMEGYYGAHLQFVDTVEIPLRDWHTKTVSATLELQITTQLQEVMRTHLHWFYELNRMLPPRQASQWAWDYTSQEFGANYLGHVLHYLEGKIMEIRANQEEHN